MSIFDNHQLDAEAQEKLDGRRERGEKCLDIVNPTEEPRTAASDAISDILTFVIGAAGLSIAEKREATIDPDGVHYRLVHDANRISEAESLLDSALRSWEGDAEDYDTDPNPKPKPVVIVIRDPDSSNEFAVFNGPVDVYDVDLGRMDLSDPDEFAEWKASHLGGAAAYRKCGQDAVADQIEDLVAQTESNYGHDMVLPEVERELPEELP